MFRNVLVPTDLNPKTGRALEVAARLIVEEGGKITLLHVIETIEDVAFEEYQEFYEKLLERAKRKMAEMALRYRRQGAEIEETIVYGRRVQEIVRFADEREIDLIVLSSHKIDIDTPGREWGTISYKVGFLSQCHVMLVK